MRTIKSTVSMKTFRHAPLPPFPHWFQPQFPSEGGGRVCGGVYKRKIKGVKFTGCGHGFFNLFVFPLPSKTLIFSTWTHGVGPSCTPSPHREFPVSTPPSHSPRISAKMKKDVAKTKMMMEMIETIFFLCSGMLRKSNEFEAYTHMTKTPAHKILQSSATAETLRHRGFDFTL